MERQDLIDVIAEGIQDAIDIDTGPHQWAVGVIRALEAAGYKIMEREPTERMCAAMYPHVTGSGSLDNLVEPAFHAAFDAAPTYGEDQ